MYCLSASMRTGKFTSKWLNFFRQTSSEKRKLSCWKTDRQFIVHCGPQARQRLRFWDRMCWCVTDQICHCCCYYGCCSIASDIQCCWLSLTILAKQAIVPSIVGITNGNTILGTPETGHAAPDARFVVVQHALWHFGSSPSLLACFQRVKHTVKRVHAPFMY